MKSYNTRKITPAGGWQVLASILGAPMQPEQFLRLAIGIAAALGELYKQNIIHGNINVRTIFIKNSGDAVIIADPLGGPPLQDGYSEMMNRLTREGTPAYMSPEQTGRMNRTVDYRTDFYSTGVVFYEMLVGTLPFQATDTLEWVHCHVARSPQAPLEVIPQLPPMLSEIVMKLLAKTAEERYQTASGLRYDLEKCLTQWTFYGQVEHFNLGGRDISDRLLIPQKLYGREQDIDVLLSAFERVVAQGTPEMVLVTGYSGIGKTSLVRELSKPVVREHGIFISGKFDQYKRNMPYFTIAEAFRELIQQILTVSDTQIEDWRERFQRALGINARIIIDIIPQFELIIGRAFPVPELGPAEARNRFNMVFRHFVGVFAKKEHPVVFFLDDLQWIDPASLRLLEDVFAHDETRYLLLIGAYRDNEVTATHPLMLALDNVRKSGTMVRTLALTPLSPSDLSHLLTDTLHSDQKRIASLTSLIYQKTIGNPFFAIRFLMMLHSEKLIEFNEKKGRWQWDTDRIQARGFTDNVVELMVSKLNKLFVGTQGVLGLAACIGNRFDLHILALISGLSYNEVRERIEEALQESLVHCMSGSICIFAHDRIQQAAYSLLNKNVRNQTHLTIGRTLLANCSGQGIQDQLFEIVGQFNINISLIDDPAEKLRIAALNLDAAQKAILSAAYKSARQFALAAWQLLQPALDWAANYELLRRLYSVLAETEFLNSNLERSKELISIAISHLQTNLEKAELLNLIIIGQTLEGAYAEAVESGRTGLALLGIGLPGDNPELAYQREVEEINDLVANRPLHELLDAHKLTDPHYQMAQKILLNVDVPAYISIPALYPFIIAKMVHNSLLHGNSQESCKSYCNYGMLLGAFFGQYQRGYEFAMLGWRLVSELNALAVKCKTTWPWAVTQAWVKPLRETFTDWEEGIRAGMETGDLQFVGYDLFTGINVRYIAGELLPQLDHRIAQALDFSRSSNNQWAMDSLRALWFAVQGLSSSDNLADIPPEEVEFLADCTQRGNLSSLCVYHCYRAQRLIFAGLPESALEHAEKAQGMTGNILGSQVLVDANFYHSLALIEMLSEKIDGKKYYRKLMLQLKANQAILKQWRDACPPNLDHKYLLVEAGIARLAGRTIKAMDSYEGAIRSAMENGFIQDEGLAFEAAAGFYRQRGFRAFADTYLRNAYACYMRWGANGKAKQLKALYPWLLNGGGLLAANEGGVDAITVTKASQAISGEIVLSNLLDKLMRIVIENAGARKGYLLLLRGSEPFIAAQVFVEGKDIKVQLETWPVSPDILPLSVINYVGRTGESVILDDAATANMFCTDAYISRNRTASLFCIPIMRQTKMIGFLYLENDLVKGAFPVERTAVLEVLAAQAAISLENSTLYTALSDNQRLLQAIIDNSSAIIYVKDTQGRYLLVNRRFRDLFHVMPETGGGKTDHDIFPKEQADAFQVVDGQVLATGIAMEAEEAVPHDDGLHTYISIKAPLLDKHGKPYAVCGISTDITERKMSEKEICRLNEELQQKVVELIETQEELVRKEKLAILGQLSGSVGHELRNPLGVMNNAIYFLKMSLTNADETTSEYLDIIKQEIDNSLRIITDLLDFARTKPPQPKMITVRELIDGSIRKCAIPENIAVQTNIPETLPLLWIDSLQMNQVLQNLITNGIQAMPDGGELRVYAQQIQASEFKVQGCEDNNIEHGTLNIEPDADFVEISVTDTGEGISGENMKKLFQPLFTTKARGIGLGLVVCKNLVEANGGRIDVESRDGQGTIFTIILPIEKKAS